MTAIGGSIESLTLDGREFAVAADADTNRFLGGDVNEVLANGNGTGRLQKTVTPWMIDGLVIEIDDARGDAEFIKALVDSSRFFPVSITYASQEVYQGQGQITGDTNTASQATTMTVNLKGTGILTKQ